MKTILAAVDFSGVTPRVVEAAAELARAFEGEVHLIHAIAPPVNVVTYDMPIEAFARELEYARESTERKLAEISGPLAAAGVPYTTQCLEGHVVEILVNAARERRAAFIVMGSHGHGAIYELLAGSTTHGVLHRAACPVLVLPSKVAEIATTAAAA